MHSVKRSVLVPYSTGKMFDLVADVPRYPEFMPWCGGGEINEQFENGNVASVTISISKIKQTFTTRNILDYSNSIKMELVRGPFSQLFGVWEFIELDANACKVVFTLDYAFSNKPLEFLIGPIFNRIANSFIDSFTARAEAIYGTE